MVVAYGIILAGIICLIVGSSILMNDNLNGLAFFAIGWALIIYGIRRVVVYKKDESDARR